MSEPRNPWLGGLAAGMGSALVAWVAVALIDALAAGLATAPALLAMWAPLALGIGLAVGLASAGIRATFGEGAVVAGLRRVRRDRGLDAGLTGAVLAAGGVAVLVILVVKALAGILVADVKRPDTGAYLLGIAVVLAIPPVALLGFPIFRITRAIARWVPPIGPAPAVLVLTGAALILGFAGANYVIYTQLDWQVLGMGGWYLLIGLFAGTPLLLALSQGPLAGLVGKVPGRGIAVVAGAAVALALPFLTLRGRPSDEVRNAITDDAMGGAKLLRAYRGLFDGDGDGKSPFFGGPDCDDTDPEVFNGAYEEPDGDGVDQDCDGRDRPAEEPDADPDADAAEPVAEGDGAGAPRPAAEKLNVLLLLIDTLRADRVGAYGLYQRDGASLTPELDRFAATAMRFDRAYSQASNTPRAMPALMTSRYPSMIKVDDLYENYPRIDDSELFVTEVMQEAGIATYGFSSHYYFKPERNFAEQGFTAYDNEGATSISKTNKAITAPQIVPKVVAKLDELAATGQQFAMWVHLYEPHASYMEHGEPITERGTEAHKQRYDYEIRFVDRWAGKIFAGLESSGLSARTVVVVVSDHGEAFAIHRFGGETMMFHGQTLYDELLHIPLLIRAPGLAPGVSKDVVQLIDIAPTLLDLLGIARPDRFLGRSLVPALRGEPLKPRPSYAELIPYKAWNHEARSVVSPDGRWKLFDRISDNKKELYDLEADREERRDLFKKQPEKARELEDLLLKFMDLKQREAPR